MFSICIIFPTIYQLLLSNLVLVSLVYAVFRFLVSDLIFFCIFKLFVDINFWQHPSKLSTSAAALFDTVLIAQHIPQALAGSSLEHVPSPLQCMTSVDDSVPGECSSQTSSAFSDSWSSMESPYIHRKLYMRGEDLLSEMGSVCSSEVSTLVDESFSEWPFVQIVDCHPRNITSRRLPVTENFVAELKPRAPVPHGLLRSSCDNSWATLSARQTELTRPCVNENGPRGIDNTVKVSHYAVPQKRKEMMLSISTVKSSICSIEETRTCQKVVVGECIADRIQADDSQLPAENLSHDTSASECTVESGHTGRNERQSVLFRCIVEPEFSTAWWKDEDCCRTRLEVCRRELISVGDFASSCNKQCGICSKAPEDVAVQLYQPLRSTASSKSAAQLTTVPTDGGSPATVQCDKKVCPAKRWPCDSDRRVPEIVQDIGRSHSAEELSKVKHSLNAVNSSSLQMIQVTKCSSNQPTSVYCFSNELHRSEEGIHKRLEICRRDPVVKYLDGRIMSASWNNVLDLNVTCSSKSEKNLELLPTLWVHPPNKVSVVGHTVVARQSLLTLRTCYTRAASEPRQVSGNFVLSHASTSSPDISSHSLESKNGRSEHDNEYRNDVLSIHSAQRTSLGVVMALSYDDERLNTCRMCCYNLSDVLQRRQMVTCSDNDGTGRTNAAQSEDLDDKDASIAVLERQSPGTCKLNGFKSSSDEGDTIDQLQEESLSGYRQLYHSVTVLSEDLPPVQSVPNAISSLPLSKTKEPAGLCFHSPSAEEHTGTTGMRNSGIGHTSTTKCSYEHLADGDVLDVMCSEDLAETSDKKPAEDRSVKLDCIVQDDAADLRMSDGYSAAVGEEDKAVMELSDTVDSQGWIDKIQSVKVEEVLSYGTCSRTVADANTEVKVNDKDVCADKSPKARAVFGYIGLEVAGGNDNSLLDLAAVSFVSTVNTDIDTEDNSVKAGAICDEDVATDKNIDSVSDTAVCSYVRTLTACDDVSADAFSERVTAPDDCTDSATEISASTSAPNDVTSSDSKIAVDSSVIDPQRAQVSELASESGVESDITVHDELTKPREETSAENSRKRVTVMRSCSDRAVDVSGDGDGITSREEFVQSVIAGNSVPHVLVRSDELLDIVPYGSDSLADISSQPVDLLESLSYSVSQPPTSSVIDRQKADQLQVTPASHQVNGELHSGDASMSTLVLLAY